MTKKKKLKSKQAEAVDFMKKNLPKTYAKFLQGLPQSRKTQPSARKDDRWIIFNRDGFRCFYCGKPAFTGLGTKLEIDHIFPISKGGISCAIYLVTACSECNRSKSAKNLNGQVLQDIYLEIKRRNKEHGIPDRKVLRV